jgi:hypothetical protein
MNSGLTVTLDWDTVDAVIEKYLIDSHTSITQQIKILKAKRKRKDYEQEDLENFENVLNGINIMGEWCVFDFQKKVKKHAKQQL